MDVHLPTDRETGRPRGFAFVEFASEAEAAEAIRLFNARDLDGRTLRLDPAEHRPPRSGGFRPDRPSGPSFGPGSRPSGGAAPRHKPFKAKGSRRGIRGRKRSL